MNDSDNILSQNSNTESVHVKNEGKISQRNEEMKDIIKIKDDKESESKIQEIGKKSKMSKLIKKKK